MNLLPYCEFCGKQPVKGFNRPKSLHKTKRTIRPNIQKWEGMSVCTKCRRTIKNKLEKQLTVVKATA